MAGSNDIEVTAHKMAIELLARKADMERKAGGLTPEALQELCGLWLDTTNPAFSVQSLKDILSFCRVLLDSGLDEREVISGLGMALMHAGFVHAFDFYQSVYDNLDLSLNNWANKKLGSEYGSYTDKPPVLDGKLPDQMRQFAENLIKQYEHPKETGGIGDGR